MFPKIVTKEAYDVIPENVVLQDWHMFKIIECQLGWVGVTTADSAYTRIMH